MIEKVKECFESEYKSTKQVIEAHPWWVDSAHEIVNGTISRCLGIAMFAQRLEDVKYEEIESLFNEYKEKLRNLLEEA